MHPLFKMLGQAAQWSVKHPQTSQLIARGLGISYRNLKPNEKRRVDAILRQCATMLTKAAVGEVAHWAASEADSQGFDHRVVCLVENRVRRAAEVGVDRAMAEMERG